MSTNPLPMQLMSHTFRTHRKRPPKRPLKTCKACLNNHRASSATSARLSKSTGHPPEVICTVPYIPRYFVVTEDCSLGSVHISNIFSGNYATHHTRKPGRRNHTPRHWSDSERNFALDDRSIGVIVGGPQDIRYLRRVGK